MNYWRSGNTIQNGKYVIEATLGGGGFGVTYRAREESSGKLVAIKTLNILIQSRSDFAKHQERFVQEAFYLAKCNHPHIIPVKDVCKEGGLWCMVMEFIVGKNLEEYVEEKEILAETEALEYIQQIGDALTYIHQQGFLHRDVKPANIMIRQDNGKAVLIDFGLARDFIEGKTQTHTSSFTPSFAPIEQYQTRAKRGAYTDVYSLAATLYYLLTKELPLAAMFRSGGEKLIPPQQHNSQISDRINEMILRGMALQPHQRPQSIGEWLQQLKSQPVTTFSPPPPTPVTQPVTPNSIKQPPAPPPTSVSQAKKTPKDKNIDSSGNKSLRYQLLCQLKDLLEAGEWQKADRLTYTVLLNIGKRENQGWLDKDTIVKLPCEYISIIDQMWVKYSQGRFGFSVQQNIWQQVSGNINYLNEFQLSDRVGWRVNTQWLDYQNLSFNLNAPRGHLPSCSLGRWLWSWTWRGQCYTFFARIESCNL
ncbi:MAG: GUN4 domain-containing protein [Xenococcaceae cyanobacterium]